MSTKNISIETVKTCDLGLNAAIAAFIGLNAEEGMTIVLTNPGEYPPILQTDDDPKEMLYPQGWYFAKKSYRNKHHSSTGFYEEVMLRDSSRKFWEGSNVDDVRQIAGEDISASVMTNIVVELNPHAIKLDDTLVKLTKPEKLDCIFVPEGWDISVDNIVKVIMLKSGDKCVRIVVDMG